MPTSADRRRFLAAVAAGCTTAALAGPIATASAADAPPPKRVPPRVPTLGFRLYGMKDLPTAEALSACAALGYDDVELALLPGYATEPATLSKPHRAELRKVLDGTGLAVPALMENLRAVVDDRAHRANLDRIARAAELAHDLSATNVPVLETVLGGTPADWPAMREPMIGRLRGWAEAARKHDLVVAVKPHVGGALHRADDAARMIDAVGSPNLRAVYDYSHYQVQDLPLSETLDALIGHTVFVHVKDGERRDGKTAFLLPGEGRTDYADYFRKLVARGYAGSITVEVSAMLHKRPDYDAVAAAKRSYVHLADAWKKAGLPPRDGA